MKSPIKLQSVLYVDDDPDICEVVQTSLCALAGLTVRIAGSGALAIDLANELRPDLVLMDVMMPGLDGPTTFRQMRESASLADIPVIFMTAKVMPAEMERFRRLGAIGVIAKPFDPLKLSDNVNAIWATMHSAMHVKSSNRVESTVQLQVGSLADRYIERTRGDVLSMRSLIERAQLGDESVLAEIERMAHSIHGAGAMFGFPDVSASGAAIERLAEGAACDANSGLAVKPHALNRLMDRAVQLAREVESADRAPPGAGAIS